MNVYRVRRTDEIHYDQFDAFVCVAESEAAALAMFPWHDDDHNGASPYDGVDDYWGWPSDRTTVVTLIATDAQGPARVVLSSFNAG